jgi:hypothetical protein
MMEHRMARQLDIIDIEMWRDIPGFDGVYQASTHGRIRRFPRLVPTKGGAFALKEFAILAGRDPKHVTGRYNDIALVASDGRQVRKGVHWLVCRAFHGPMPTSEHEAAHFDGNRNNNRADNLRWATRKENAADRKRHGNDMEGERHPSVKLTAAAVRDIRANCRGRYGDLERMAQKHGVTRSLVWNVVNRRTWKHI